MTVDSGGFGGFFGRGRFDICAQSAAKDRSADLCSNCKIKSVRCHHRLFHVETGSTRIYELVNAG